jgi:4-hydroxybenzoate polyprenyltransferase
VAATNARTEAGELMLDQARRTLVVDLDDTLIRSDLLVEGGCVFLGQSPHRIGEAFGWLLQGRATLKQRLADAVEIDPATLPYNTAVLARIGDAKAAGSKVYIASASNVRWVSAVADHLGLDGVFASDPETNLKGRAKAERLTDAFGAGGFDYIGDSEADLSVWAVADRAITNTRSPRVRRKAEQANPRTEHLPQDRPKDALSAWVRLLRPHQWAKNALIGLPLLTAHAFALAPLVQCLLAFVAFSLCASSVYVVNDLIDIQADRGHPTKSRRPFASGAIPIRQGAVMAPVLLAASIAAAAVVGGPFLLVLAAYYVTTTAYTFFLKRKTMIDVVTLAGLYTVRVIGGGVAIGAAISEWLLAFSMFIFLALALIKRHSEMAIRLDAGLPDPSNRDYRASDLPLLISLASAAGYSAVIVFALYLSSPAVHALYRHPKILWLDLPLLIYWISRAITMSHRRTMHDDPVVFALRDRVSLGTVALCGLLGLAAL